MQEEQNARMERLEKANDEMKDQMRKMMEMMAKFVKEKGKETPEVSESETTDVYPPGSEPNSNLGLSSGLEHATVPHMLPQYTFQSFRSYPFVPQSSPIDKEQARLFINTFKPPYYGYLLSGINKDITDLVVLGEMIDISFKNGKLEEEEGARNKNN
ncbi:hypothetical protein COLO4_06670 [Corchorus olitorius]|uniref:Uncharacterized protein n=1 Tax=Corchorus olitorius TaxID=93759 RepID=A0A1R3KMD9_9ROSI|nr:hypothetical protein COLO4_06670 [Corchorus olitorius]